jgi:aminopeptidase N
LTIKLLSLLFTSWILLNSPNSYQEWWDIQHFEIDLKPDYNRKFISGTNTIQFKVLRAGQQMKIDLFQPMNILRVLWRNQSLPFHREENAYLIEFPSPLHKYMIESISIEFEGHPQEATKPPWESGWIWTSDKMGRPWVSVAAQGTGAAVWLPCKNQLNDEPNLGVLLNITVPDTLVAIANGKLTKSVINKDRTTTYQWKVANPINHYSIIPYIGKYANSNTSYHGLKGILDRSYCVLDYNIEKAQQHFRQTDTILSAFEYWMGPYPFYEDGYKIVEAPMPGMEHQSAIAYGNHFENGYAGTDMSSTGWGLKWDFMLVHESGHEWFGNSITANSVNDSWFHEAFGKYLETLYTDYAFGTVAGDAFSQGIWKRIKNDAPVIGSGTSDQYYKGSALLHMIRKSVGDEIFRQLLHSLNKQYYHSTITTEQLLNHINNFTGTDFTKIFEQYLRSVDVPVLEYYFKQGYLHFRWTNCVQGFNLAVPVTIGNKNKIITKPTTAWSKIKTGRGDSLSVDKNYYIKISKTKE